MKTILDISNKVGGIMCLLVVANFWFKKALIGLMYKPKPIDFNYFEFLEGGKSYDPDDFANIIFLIIKTIVSCVI